MQKGNTALVGALSEFICERSRRAALLAKNYKATIGAPLPPMPTLPLNTARGPAASVAGRP